MIRRKAVEAFRSLAPEGDTASNQSDATELPMSGLILALEQDIVGKGGHRLEREPALTLQTTTRQARTREPRFSVNLLLTSVWAEELRALT
jgi:hypothetical protein